MTEPVHAGKATDRIAELEKQLDSFDPAVRSRALGELKRLADRGEIEVPRPVELVNLHYHTFFSFNAYGYSPSSIVWKGYRQGMEMVGTLEFDTLEGMEETLRAGDSVELKTCVGLETRVFVKEYADRVINSPREPGVYYMMGMGFYKKPEAGSFAESVLKDMAGRAQLRNITMMHKINAFLREVQIDYEKDVLMLTPAGNATERHMLAAYDQKAREVFKDIRQLARFWAKATGTGEDEISTLLGTPHLFRELVRARLMKHGGVGYAIPEQGSFPSLEEVTEMVSSLGALPTPSWNDGTSPGESNPREFLEFFAGKGGVAINVIPDRNINLDDPKEKQTKTRNLQNILKVARDMDLLSVVGTEMNRHGQPFTDDFTRPELEPFVPQFMRAARVLYAHTVLARTGEFGYMSDWARQVFGRDRTAKNNFFENIGTGPVIGPDRINRLRELPGDAAPQDIIRTVRGEG